MDISFTYPGPPCEVPGFDPDEDVLVIVLPDTLLASADPRLSLYHDHAANRLDLSVSLTPNAPPLEFHLPGLATLPSDAVVLVSLSESTAFGPVPTQSEQPSPPPTTTSAALTGKGLYPPESALGSGPSSAPINESFAPRHDWQRDGPPPERFFDLSNPASQLSITLPPATQGPVHAVRFVETTAEPGSSNTHNSIVLIQSPPGSPSLAPAALTTKFATNLGAPDFRAIAWIWLGNEGYVTDPVSNEKHAFDRINRNPSLTITGPIAGSVEVRH